jgi:S1-C subfamily serine protease
MTRSDRLGLVGVSLAWLLAACQSKAPDPPSAPPVAPAASAEAAPSQAWPAIDWTNAPDCQAKLGLLVEAVRAGHWRSDERPPIAVVVPGAADQLDWLAPPSVTVTADLPLEVHERTDPAIRQTACLLLVEAARDQRVGQRLIGRETVRSLYESGVRSERNPEYDAAQVRVRKAERATKDKTPGILRVGDPVLDLFGLLVGGVISGFSQGRRERELDAATTALAATPRSLDQPVYQPYQFEQQTILAGKEATIPVALVDRANRRLWRAELHQRERRQFEILEGLDPRDRDYQKRSASGVSRYDFERWQRKPPQLQLSAIIAALREARPATGAESVTAAIDRVEPGPLASEPGTIEPVGPPPEPVFEPARDRSPSRRRVRPRRASPEPADLEHRIAPADGAGNLLAEVDAESRLRAAVRPAVSAPELTPGAGPAVTPGGERRKASVVRVNAGTRAGSGVYIRSDLVLTTAKLVAGSAVVEIATADGTRVLGLVARADRARDLALVQVARPGPPVALYDGPALPSGRPVEAIALAEDAGVVLMPGRYRAAGSSSTDLVQVDMRTPPVQPEGLPWFLGDRLIGVGAGGADQGAQGSLFAVRASEIRDFLHGASGALAAVP